MRRTSTLWTGATLVLLTISCNGQNNGKQDNSAGGSGGFNGGRVSSISQYLRRHWSVDYRAGRHQRQPQAVGSIPARSNGRCLLE